MTNSAPPPIRHRLVLGIVLTIATASILMGGSGFAALAHDDHAEDHGTAAATPEGSPAASINSGTGIVYLTIVNTGTTARLLVDARTDAARDVSFHASGGGGDVMRMTEQAGGFPIGPGETLTLEPGGAHLMLENLNHDLRPGSTFTIRLSFIDESSIEVDVTVGAEAPDGDPDRLGELLIYPAWSLPAPRLGDGPSGTPEATPHHGH